tara:strand:- start:2 stop:574 length:573 start_codon:yes stop_codon:yes gene_type:complete
MFGHDSLNYGNIHTLLHNAETRTFNAATEKPASWTGDYYEIKCRGNGAYRTAFLKSTGEQATSNMGNQTMLDSQKIAYAVAALPSGTYYEVIGGDCMPSSSSGGTSGRSGNGNGNGNGDETPAGECLDENREDATDETGCGECLSGYEEDDTGTCVAIVEEEEESNTMRNLAIGGVVIGGIYAYFTYFRK